ncbi:MAG TPA: glycosyltransferase [Casimicrobiaceae bacterium]|nr:glycosyltransferase [Casimicrobiaceae bacterium]
MLHAARRVAVHNAIVAEELRGEQNRSAIDVIRMGVPAVTAAAGARARIRGAYRIGSRAIIFTALGKVTAEKRIPQIVSALAALVAGGLDVHLLLVGDETDAAAFGGTPREVAGRVHAAGYVADGAIGDYLIASDVCLCLRWPTALETSASWLRCLAAARATIVSDLAHTADVPAPVAPRIDMLDEHRSLVDAMRELATDEAAREAVARAGHAWWQEHHTMEMMTADYRSVIARAIAAPAPSPADLPRHFTEDYSDAARNLLRQMGASVDIL